ncbi:MAG: hypothetical protein AAB513_02810 [Patescibacteria group bacterium]
MTEKFDYTPEELSKMQKSRVLEDAQMINEGADMTPDGKLIVPSNLQQNIKNRKNREENEIKERQRQEKEDKEDHYIWSSNGYKAHLHLPPESKRVWQHSDVYEKLKSNNLLDRTCGVDDEQVRAWIANPSTYPEELKDKRVFLWKGMKRAEDFYLETKIPFLVWRNDSVVIDWPPEEWSLSLGVNDPSLIKSE